jgi:low affinity Fe/Cu permease
MTAAASSKARGVRPVKRLGDRFNEAADSLTEALGSLPVLVGSVLLVVIWGVTGPLFHFSDTWQLFINTTTTVITFWMVFVIQNSANRAAKATQLKLDELIRAVADARNEFIALDQAPEDVLAAREEELMSLSAEEAVTQRQAGRRQSRTKSRSSQAAKGSARPAKGSARPAKGLPRKATAKS